MKALIKKSLDARDAALAEIAKPMPGAEEILIKVHAAGICGTDLKIYQAHYHKYKAPVVMGHELSGTVAQLGPGVDGFSLGAPVTARIQASSCGKCRACMTGRDNLCAEKTRIGFEHDGAFAEYIKVNKDQVFALPIGLDLTTAALTEPVAVIVHALRPVTIKPTDVVLVVGPGPIGLLAAIFAKAEGATVVVAGLSADRNRLMMAKTLGVDVVIVSDDERDPGRQRLMELTEGEGADVVLECSGSGPGVDQGLTLCRSAGQFVQIGTRSTPVTVDFMKIAYKEIRVTGTIDHLPMDWKEAIRFTAKYASEMACLVTVYSMEAWQDAFREAEAGQVAKVVLRLGN
jgi:L-iditol 2-dehydrogenase